MKGHGIHYPKSLSVATAALHFVGSDGRANASGSAKSGGRIGGRAGFSHYRKNTKRNADASLDIPKKMYMPQHIKRTNLHVIQTPSAPLQFHTNPPLHFLFFFDMIVLFYVVSLLLAHYLLRKDNTNTKK